MQALSRPPAARALLPDTGWIPTIGDRVVNDPKLSDCEGRRSPCAGEGGGKHGLCRPEQLAAAHG